MQLSELRTRSGQQKGTLFGLLVGAAFWLLIRWVSAPGVDDIGFWLPGLLTLIFLIIVSANRELAINETGNQVEVVDSIFFGIRVRTRMIARRNLRQVRLDRVVDDEDRVTFVLNLDTSCFSAGALAGSESFKLQYGRDVYLESYLRKGRQLAKQLGIPFVDSR